MPRLSGTFGAARLHRFDSSSDGADDDGSDRPWLKGTTLGGAVAAILDRNQLFDGETDASVAAEVRRLHGLWKDEAGAAPWRARRLRSEEARLPAEAYDVVRELCVLSKLAHPHVRAPVCFVGSGAAGSPLRALLPRCAASLAEPAAAEALGWRARLDVAVDVAAALAYVHGFGVDALAPRRPRADHRSAAAARAADSDAGVSLRGAVHANNVLFEAWPSARAVLDVAACAVADAKLQAADVAAFGALVSSALLDGAGTDWPGETRAAVEACVGTAPSALDAYCGLERARLAATRKVASATIAADDADDRDGSPAGRRCAACGFRGVNAQFRPCGHAVCCDVCAAAREACPACDGPVRGVRVGFYGDDGDEDAFGEEERLYAHSTSPRVHQLLAAARACAARGDSFAAVSRRREPAWVDVAAALYARVLRLVRWHVDENERARGEAHGLEFDDVARALDGLPRLTVQNDTGVDVVVEACVVSAWCWFVLAPGEFLSFDLGDIYVTLRCRERRSRLDIGPDLGVEVTKGVAFSFGLAALLPFSLAVAPLLPFVCGGYVSAWVWADGEVSKLTTCKAPCVCAAQATDDGGGALDDGGGATAALAAPSTATPFAGHGFRTRGLVVIKAKRGALEAVEFRKADVSAHPDELLEI